jgi:dual-specificity kinase
VSSNPAAPNATTSVSSTEDTVVLYEWTPNEIIGSRYRAIQVLGEGAFGRVLEVEETSTGTHYAMKVVAPFEDNIPDAKIEAKILKRIMANPDRSPRIVTLHETFSHGQNFCFVFEKLGKSIRDILLESDYDQLPGECVKYIS